MNKQPKNLSVSELLEEKYKNHPQKEVLFDRTSRITYEELWEKSLALSASLKKMGLKKGDKLAVCLPNWNEFIIIFMASAHLGTVIVPFNTRYRQEEVEYILRNSEAKAAFFTREFSGVNHFQQFTQAQNKMETLEHLIAVRFEAEKLNSLERLIEGGKNEYFQPVKIDSSEDIFTILYTSGSTGAPKGAMLTHDNVVQTAIKSAEGMKCTEDDVFLVAVPVFHVFGMVPSILSTIASGARMVLMDEYKAGKALKLQEEERITVKHGVPTMFILELNHERFKSFDLTSLRTGIIAAAPAPEEVVRRIRTEMGCDIVVSYGLSETSPTLTMTKFGDSDHLRAETVGAPLPGAEVKIVDDDRNEVPAGVVGEIACRSYGVMKGYYNMPEKTMEAFDEDGWFYTGDLGTLDEKGYLRIVGRKKEMIIRGGYNIYPREVEEMFYKHPDVMEVAIVGLPDTVLGEIACACIKRKPNATVSEEEMRAYIKTKVSDYKVPDKLLFVDELPMTASGKIKKIALQDQLKNSLKAELR